ncbi:MAG: RNA polymerase sigma factor [bacterium]
MEIQKEENLDNFGYLYDKYVRSIYNFIYYKTHHKETAEDLTSQTFLKALDKISSFDKKKGSFFSWLYQIARNSVIDFYRTKKNCLNIEDVWDLSGNEDIERDLDAKKKLEEVQKYLKRLKPEQREIVILRVWEGMSYKEIAEVVEKTEENCKVMFSRVVQRLRKEMPLAVFLNFFVSLPF